MVSFATPQISGNAGYVLRYYNGQIVQAIRDVNSSTLNLGNGFSAKIKFTILESQMLSDFFAQNCKAPLFSQTSMSNLTFNEMYLVYNGEKFGMKAGKFYISWGTSPLENPVSLVAPYDFTNIFDSPIQRSVLAFQTTLWYENGSSLELDVIPAFSSDLFSGLESTIENVKSTPKNVQFGVRYASFVGDYNVYLDAYHGFDHAFSVRNGTLYHAPLNAMGGEFSGPFPLDQDFNMYAEAMAVFEKGGWNTRGVFGVNGFVFGSNAGTELERGLIGQNVLTPENAITFYMNKDINGILSLNLMTSFGFEDEAKYGYLVHIDVDYQPIQDVSLEIGSTYSNGDEGEYFEKNSSYNGFYVETNVYF